eukprot:3946066-Pyramimonas_sp.AAC.1
MGGARRRGAALTAAAVPTGAMASQRASKGGTVGRKSAPSCSEWKRRGPTRKSMKHRQVARGVAWGQELSPWTQGLHFGWASERGNSYPH